MTRDVKISQIESLWEFIGGTIWHTNVLKHPIAKLIVNTIKHNIKALFTYISLFFKELAVVNILNIN